MGFAELKFPFIMTKVHEVYEDTFESKKVKDVNFRKITNICFIAQPLFLSFSFFLQAPALLCKNLDIVIKFLSLGPFYMKIISQITDIFCLLLVLVPFSVVT